MALVLIVAIVILLSLHLALPAAVVMLFGLAYYGGGK